MEIKSLRKEWIEKMHAAAPGVDWRAIERSNGLKLQAMRNRTPKTLTQTWFELGSRNQAGRMHAAALASDGDSLYGGSSRGGIWKGTLDGDGWRPLSDNLYGGSHGLAVAVGPPETITSITDDGLIHYTQDGGQTWIVPTGPESDLWICKRVLRDYGTDNRIYLVSRKSGTSGKVWRSDDGGLTYTRIARLTSSRGDIWLDRVSGGDLYLQKGLQTLRTSDQGATWDTLGTIPAASASNVILTGSEAGSPTLYAAVNNGGQWELYRSTDAGTTWAYRYDINDFWETLCASIDDANLVVFAGVEMWRSTNGGGSFSKVNNWWDYYGDPLNKLHADFPGTECVSIPGIGERFYIATDGGLYKSDDGIASVTNISLDYLGVSQYYSTHTTVNDPTLIVAGSQDQGYQRSTGPAIGYWRDFDQLWSGDYGHLTSGDGSHAYLYSVYPGFLLVQKGESSPALSDYDFPPGESYNIWMPYVLGDPDQNNACYFCASHLYRYVFIGGIGHTLDTLPQDFTVAGGNFLSSFNISPVNHDRQIGCTDTGKLWYSDDGGSTWNVSPDNGPSQSYLYGTDIAFHPSIELTAYVCGSGYSGAGVYRTTDGGMSWTGVGTGLPSTMVYEIAFEGTGNGALYAATEAGPYRLDTVSDEWEYIGGSEAPITTYWCVEDVAALGVARFGTYGRGIWDYDYGVATTVADAELPLPPTTGVRNFPNPFNPSTTIRFRLEERGAYSLVVYNAAGRQVRQLGEGFGSAGEHEVVWDGTDDTGRSVASGVYMARLESGGRAWARRMVLAR